MSAERIRHVVVLGGGLAGLAAAWRLAAAGHRVTVAERAAHVGGRAALAELDGERVDPTAPRVSARDASLLGLVREAGLAGELLPLRPWRCAQWDGSRLATAAAPGALARPPGVRRLDALRLIRLPRLMRRYRRHLDPARPERSAPLDDRSLADFGALYFGRSAVENWIEPWLADSAPVDASQASRVAFLLRFAAEGEADAARLRAPVGRLAEALAARLAVRTGCAAAGLGAAAGGLEVALDGGALAADAVVLAVPAAEAVRIGGPVLTSAEQDFLAAARYDSAIAWSGAVRRLPVSEATRARVPRGAGSPFSVLALEPAGGSEGERRPPGRITAIAREPWCRAHLDAPDDALEKELAAEVARITPAAADTPGALFRFRSAWPRFDVGRYRALARFRAVQDDRRHARRRLYFAGDYLAAPTLEGAVASGLRAAEDALADLRDD